MKMHKLAMKERIMWLKTHNYLDDAKMYQRIYDYFTVLNKNIKIL